MKINWIDRILRKKFIDDEENQKPFESYKVDNIKSVIDLSAEDRFQSQYQGNLETKRGLNAKDAPKHAKSDILE